MADTHTWGQTAVEARHLVSDADTDAARRALDYLCLAQLYLSDNFLLDRPLSLQDVKTNPAGHWGVCPPVNAALAALGPVRRTAREGNEILLVHGAGHAGPAALAHAYLSGRLADENPEFEQSPAGLARLIRGFPHREQFGGEITPLIPDHVYMGGQLGPALAFAHGTVLDQPQRLTVALIGDGECETGATAAAWLGARALAGTGDHGHVLPVLLLNGQRMGGASLLSALTHSQLSEHFRGLGYHPVICGPETDQIRDGLGEALTQLRPVQDGPSALLVLTVPKGQGVPAQVAGTAVAGTSRVHKTPLRAVHTDPEEFAALGTWLAQYRPGELLTRDGAPTAAVRRALPRGTETTVPNLEAPRGCIAASTAGAVTAQTANARFGPAISQALSELNATYGLRVFSPDELSSNHLRFTGPDGSEAVPGWVVEVLNEELCHAWAQGCVETGRRALIAGYEAFAPIAASLLVQHLKYRSAARAAGRPAMPSIVYLLTSLGWNNTFTHANPGLALTALGTGDSSVHVLTPADAARAAASVIFAVRKLDRCTLVVAGKHPGPTWPLDTLDDELRHGYALWPDQSDTGHPDVVLLAAGDLAARELADAADLIRTQRPVTRVRFVAVHDLTCLGSPERWPMGIPEPDFAQLFPDDVPVLAATMCGSDTLRLLLWDRSGTERFHLRGYRDPGRPVSPDQLLRHCRMDAATLAADVLVLLEQKDPTP